MYNLLHTIISKAFNMELLLQTRINIISMKVHDLHDGLSLCFKGHFHTASRGKTRTLFYIRTRRWRQSSIYSYESCSVVFWSQKCSTSWIFHVVWPVERVHPTPPPTEPISIILQLSQYNLMAKVLLGCSPSCEVVIQLFGHCVNWLQSLAPILGALEKPVIYGSYWNQEIIRRF